MSQYCPCDSHSPSTGLITVFNNEPEPDITVIVCSQKSVKYFKLLNTDVCFVINKYL